MDRMRYTEAPRRRAELLKRVGDAGYLTSSAAAADFGVSEMTIRRDLRKLDEQGLLNRVNGGAFAMAKPFDQRRTVAISEKEAVARAAAELLVDHQVLALDAGTTVAAVASHLASGVTVVTHSVPVIVTCADRNDVELTAVGGVYHGETQSFTGPLTRAGLTGLAVDVAVLSASAADAEGAYSVNAWDADTKGAMARMAARVVLLLDHTKLDERAPNRFIELSAVDTVVVDSGTRSDHLAMLRAQCRDVVVAP